ncbi:hypothetical protein J3A83DRAFT_4360456 [Scleroderma citrinum]
MIYTPGCIELDISWLCNSDKEDHLTLTDDGDDHLGSANSLHLTLSGHFATSLSANLRLDDKLVQKIHSILSYILDARLMLESFLHAISWGNHDCAFDTLHALAVTMSHRWAADHVARISWSAMQEVTVFSQQLDNKDSFSNGVAATVYIKQQATAPAPETHCSGMQNPITFLDIFQLSMQSAPHIETYTTYYVLQFLLDAPEFQLSTYPYQHSPLLQPPHPVHAIPHGPEHIPLQYLLGSINVAEVSYADNEHLTVDHLWGLFKFCSQDINSFDRLDWMILVFGWLHLQMAFANSLHKQYLGTAAGQGLMHAFTVLKQKVSYTHQLIDEHASSGVLDQMDALPLDKQDGVKHQTILWNHDVLHYINSKCAIEVLELLQGLHWEWSLAVCDFVCEHCWLVNFAGQRNSFLPIDMTQEHNIKDIKVTYRSEGSNIQWEYFKKLHPVICLICELGKHMEQEFNTQTCRKHHSTPSKDADVKLLKSAYQSSNTHSYLPDCKLKGSKRDKVQDIVTKGLEKLHTGQTLWHWNFG